jgi:hypothetical protein
MVISNMYTFRTYQALENLYLNLQDMQQEENVKNLRKKDPLAHAKEFGTLKLTGPRQTGHTTAIQTFIRNKLINEREKWAILSPNLKMSNIFFQKLNDGINIDSYKNNSIQYKNGSLISCVGIQQFVNIGKGIELNGIIVDCASLIKPSQLEELYDIGIKAMQFQKFISFIFVE